MIKVLFFAGLRELAGKNADFCVRDSSLTVGQLRTKLAEQYPRMKPLLERSRVAVNDAIVEDDLLIPPDAEVAILPPVSGG